jgi:hypothetical protein
MRYFASRNSVGSPVGEMLGKRCRGLEACMPDSLAMSAFQDSLGTATSRIATADSRVLAACRGVEYVWPVPWGTQRSALQTLKFSAVQPIYLGDARDCERESGVISGRLGAYRPYEESLFSAVRRRAPEDDVAAGNICTGPIATGRSGFRSTRRDHTVISGFGDKGGGLSGARLIGRALEVSLFLESDSLSSVSARSDFR